MGSDRGKTCSWHLNLNAEKPEYLLLSKDNQDMLKKLLFSPKEKRQVQVQQFQRKFVLD